MARMIVVDEQEFKRAFDEALLKIEKSMREAREDVVRFRTVNYHVREMQARLEGR